MISIGKLNGFLCLPAENGIYSFRNYFFETKPKKNFPADIPQIFAKIPPFSLLSFF